MNQMNILIMGMGYVGITTGLVFAELGQKRVYVKIQSFSYVWVPHPIQMEALIFKPFEEQPEA